MRTLGISAQEIYRNWEKAKPGPGQIVLGRIMLLGDFSWLNGKIIAHERTRRGVATYRPATVSELAEIDLAILEGRLQVEAAAVSGVVTRKHRIVYRQHTCIYHQATGRKLEETI